MVTETTPRERVRRRRRSSSGRGGLSTATEARGANPDSDEEVADLNINEEVMEQARSGQPFQPPHQPEGDFTPRNRMKDVRRRGGAYEREYRLQLLHRMLMRRVPLDEVARELDISVHTVLKDRQELYRRLRDEAKKLDINQLVGDTLGFFGEIQGMALRAASLKKSPLNLRLAAMRTALSSKNDQNKFLQASGVFDVLRYRAIEDDSSDDLKRLMELTESIVSGAQETEQHIQNVKEDFPELEGYELEEEDEEVEVKLF